MSEVRRQAPKREMIFYTGSNFAEIKAAWDAFYEWTTYPPTLTDYDTHLIIDGVGGMPATQVDPGWAIVTRSMEWYRDPMWSPEAIDQHFGSSGFSIQQKTVTVPTLSLGGTANLNVTWVTAFADANYSTIPVPVGEAGSMAVAVASTTAGGCVVQVKALQDLPDGGSIQVTGIHP